MAVEATCHCGAIRIEVDSEPETVTDCNCSICRRYGVLWAYYPRSAVRVTATGDGEDLYQCNDRALHFRRCKTCGCVTQWTPVDDTSEDRTGINARLMPPSVLAAARLRKLDGADTWRYFDEDS